MKNSIPSKTTALAADQKAMEGVDKYLASDKAVTIGGKTYSPAGLKAVLQAEIDGEKAVAEARAQYKQQLVAAGLARAKARVMRKGLGALVLNRFGADAVAVLESFGFSAPKAPGPKTAQSKAQAVDKATKTRKAKKEALASVDAQPPTPPAPPAVTVTPPKP